MIPIAPPWPSDPKRRSTSQSPPMKTAAPTSIQPASSTLVSSAASSSRSKLTAAISSGADAAQESDDPCRELQPAGEQARQQ